MTVPSSKKNAGFTLVELLIGLSLSLMVMSAVLSSYVFLGRNFTRSLGIASANQPTLEAQSRRALAYFTQDVQVTSALSGISNSEITLSVPLSTGGTKNVTYYYNSSSSPTTVYSITALPKSLTRIDRNTNTAFTLQTNLLSCSINYYDATGIIYTSYTDYLSGIKQLSLTFTSQAGSSVNGTLTQVYQTASPKIVMRNRSLLP